MENDKMFFFSLYITVFSRRWRRDGVVILYGSPYTSDKFMLINYYLFFFNNGNYYFFIIIEVIHLNEFIEVIYVIGKIIIIIIINWYYYYQLVKLYII